MTAIEIHKVKGHIVSLKADGHTGYGVEGEDIVCAALSSIIQTAALGLMQAAGIDIKIVRREKEGYFGFTLPELSDLSRRDADMILDTMLLGISDLYEEYSDFIELKVS